MTAGRMYSSTRSRCKATYFCATREENTKTFPMWPASPPAARLRMTVTSGFYVRSLCHDLGAALGALGVMASLVRTRQADFTLGRNVLEYDNLAEGEEGWGPRVRGMLEGWIAERDEGIGTDDKGKGHKGGMGAYERRGRERWRGGDGSRGRRRRNSSSDG